MKHGCAANTCRQPGAGWWVQGRVRVSLCERHGRIYKSLGYVPVQTLTSPTQASAEDSGR